MDPFSTKTPADSPLTMQDILASPAYRELATPKLRVGDPAFPFTLSCLDMTSGVPRATGRAVSLRSFRGRQPVALVFGSYTCPPFRAQLGALESLYERFDRSIAFFIVYIKEAHPEDGWALESNRRDRIIVKEPATSAERAMVAGACATRLHIRIPILIDGPDNVVASAYGGWPDRLYLVGKNGRIAFQGEEGPLGFKPDELKRAIEEELIML